MAVLESDSEHESRDESGMPEQAPGSGLTASSAEQHDREVDEAIAQDELDDAQLDDTLSPDHYDASDLKVLEGEVLPPESELISRGRQLLDDIRKEIRAIESIGRR